ncbi:unnamed protein product [Mortierella alpina]
MSLKDPRLRGRAAIVPNSNSPTQSDARVASPTIASPTNASPTHSSPRSTPKRSDSSAYTYPGASNYRPRENQRGRERDRGRERPPLGSNHSFGSDTSATDRTGVPYVRPPPPDPRSDRANSSRTSPRRQYDRDHRQEGRLDRGRSPPAARSRGDSPQTTARYPLSSDSAGSTFQRNNNNYGSNNTGGSRASVATSANAISTVTRYRNPFEKASVPSTIVPSTIMPSPIVTSTIVPSTIASAPHPVPERRPSLVPARRMSAMGTESVMSPSSREPDYTRMRGQTPERMPDQDSRHRHRSKSRARSSVRGRSRSRSRDRGRSKSRAYSLERGRSKGRAHSRDRGRSKSRARSKSRLRSRSRPVRRIITMGDYVSASKRARSRSRARSKYDSFESSDSSLSDSSYYDYRSKGSRHRKRARYYSVSSDSDVSDGESSLASDDSGLISDAPLAQHRVRPSSRATANSDPAERLNGPVKLMQVEMDQLTDKFATRMHKLGLTFRKMKTLSKRIKYEMRELNKELTHHKEHAGPQDETALASVSTPKIYSGQAASSVASTNGTPRALEPIPPPPSLIPVSSSGKARAGDSVSYDRVAKRAFPHPRASGYMRVFEQSQYTLPIANQPVMAVLSITSRTVHEKAFAGRSSRPMVLNPFSHQTEFDGIAAASALDGYIHFWDINTQKHLLAVPPKENRVIPYAETISWVAQDTIVGVSRLKDGIPWPDPLQEATANENPTHLSLPETQTNLVTIYFRKDRSLAYKVVTITSMPHTKPISTVTAAMREGGSMSYITGGVDKRLFHWKFLAPNGDPNSTYVPEKLEQLHQSHTAPITGAHYSHHSKTLYTCGLDSRYVNYDIEAQRIIGNYEPNLGKLIHITQNPVDPRINALTSLSRNQQFSLMDERTPGRSVLRFGFVAVNPISKLSNPSWHPDGGLFCTGTNVEGETMLWDVRWNGIRMETHRRPGAGVVTGNVKFNNTTGTGTGTGTAAAAAAAGSHPIFKNNHHHSEKRTRAGLPGGPSQILNVGGARVINTLFHPTRNVMISQNSDMSLTFMDYAMRSDPIV